MAGIGTHHSDRGWDPFDDGGRSDREDELPVDELRSASQSGPAAMNVKASR
jgi:hypothetical protein